MTQSSNGNDGSNAFGFTTNLKLELNQIYNTSKLWITLVWTGISVGVLAAGIDIISQWLGSLKSGRCSTAFYLNEDFCCWGGNTVISSSCSLWLSWAPRSYILRYLIYVILTVLFGSIASILVSGYAPSARLSGIPEIKTIVDGALRPHFLSAKTLIIKTLGLCLIVGAGIWVGKEGPLVHVACCCANLAMTVLFPTTETTENGEGTRRHPGGATATRYGVRRLREILPAASAAGISVAFGAPIGGVLFAVEAISAYYANDSRTLWHSFVCAMVAAVSLQYMNPFRTGKLVLFQVVYDRIWHRFELLPFAFIGVLGGLYGATAIKLNMIFSTWRKQWKILSSIPPVLEVAAVALVTGLISYPVFYMRLQSSVLLSYLFQECSAQMPYHLCDVNYWFSTMLLLVFSAIVGLILTAYSFGINIPAGTLMPSMVVGALGGRAVGLLMQAWQVKNPDLILFSSCPPNDGSGGVCITPGVYAVVGAAASLTGITRLTVSSVVILFELTGALNYVLPIMTGVMVSKWVAQAFETKGIYEAWIDNHIKYPLLDNNRNIPIPDVPVANYMMTLDELPVIIAETANAKSLNELLQISTAAAELAAGTAPMNSVSSSASLSSSTSLSGFIASGFPLVDNMEQRNILGYIFRDDLEDALLRSSLPIDTDNEPIPCYFTDDSLPAHPGGMVPPGIDLRSVIERFPPRLSYKAQLILAVKMFQELGLTYLLLTDRGKLIGLLTKRDVWNLLSTSEYDILRSQAPDVKEPAQPASSTLLFDSGEEDRSLLEQETNFEI